MQWVAKEAAVPCTVRIAGDLLDEAGNFKPDSMREEAGFCEPSCRELAIGDIVQFERYGYARLDRKDGDGLVFIFSC
jgi:glutamyl-tRNA synthetase